MLSDGALEWRIGSIMELLFIQERVHRERMLLLQDALVIVAL